MCFHPEGNDRFIGWHMSYKSKKVKSSILKRYQEKFTKWTINKVELLRKNEIMDDIWFEDVENNRAWFVLEKMDIYIYIYMNFLIRKFWLFYLSS
jgi:hypothetical protein